SDVSTYDELAASCLIGTGDRPTASSNAATGMTLARTTPVPTVRPRVERPRRRCGSYRPPATNTDRAATAMTTRHTAIRTAAPPKVPAFISSIEQAIAAPIGSTAVAYQR